jgi:uncharacterized protein YneF (UPF0154 family)
MISSFILILAWATVSVLVGLWVAPFLVDRATLDQNGDTPSLTMAM